MQARSACRFVGCLHPKHFDDVDLYLFWGRGICTCCTSTDRKNSNHVDHVGITWALVNIKLFQCPQPALKPVRQRQVLYAMMKYNGRRTQATKWWWDWWTWGRFEIWGAVKIFRFYASHVQLHANLWDICRYANRKLRRWRIYYCTNSSIS